MAKKNVNWTEVETKLAVWCHWAIENGVEVTCRCPEQEELINSPPEALNRLYKALKAGAYHGDWKRYLGAQKRN